MGSDSLGDMARKEVTDQDSSPHCAWSSPVLIPKFVRVKCSEDQATGQGASLSRNLPERTGQATSQEVI